MWSLSSWLGGSSKQPNNTTTTNNNTTNSNPQQAQPAQQQQQIKPQVAPSKQQQRGQQQQQQQSVNSDLHIASHLGFNNPQSDGLDTKQPHLYRGQDYQQELQAAAKQFQPLFPYQLQHDITPPQVTSSSPNQSSTTPTIVTSQQQQQQPTILALPHQPPLSTHHSRRDIWQLYYTGDDEVQQYLSGISTAVDLSNDLTLLLDSAKQNVCLDVDACFSQCYPHLLFNNTNSASLSLTELSIALARALVVMGGDVGLLRQMSKICLDRAARIDAITKTYSIPSYFGETNPASPSAVLTGDDGPLSFPDDLPKRIANVVIDENELLKTPQQTAITINNNNNPHIQIPSPLLTAKVSPVEQQSVNNKDKTKSNTVLPPTIVLPSTTSPTQQQKQQTSVSTTVLPSEPQKQQQQLVVASIPNATDHQCNHIQQQQQQQPYQLCTRCHGQILGQVYRPTRHLSTINHFCAHTNVFLPSLGDNQGIYNGLKRSLTVGRPIKLNIQGLTILSPLSTFVQHNLILLNEYRRKYGYTIQMTDQYQELYKLMLYTDKYNQKNQLLQQHDDINTTTTTTTTLSNTPSNNTNTILSRTTSNNTSTSTTTTSVSPKLATTTNVDLTTFPFVPYKQQQQQQDDNNNNSNENQNENNIKKQDDNNNNNNNNEIYKMNINKRTGKVEFTCNIDLNNDEQQIYSNAEQVLILPLIIPQQSATSHAVYRSSVRPQDGKYGINHNNNINHQNNQHYDLDNDNDNDEEKDKIMSKMINKYGTPEEQGYYTHLQLNTSVDTRGLLRNGSFVSLSFLHHHVHTKLRLSEDSLFIYWMVDTSTSSVELRKPVASPLPSPVIKEFNYQQEQNDLQNNNNNNYYYRQRAYSNISQYSSTTADDYQQQQINNNDSLLEIDNIDEATTTTTQTDNKTIIKKQNNNNKIQQHKLPSGKDLFSMGGVKHNIWEYNTSKQDFILFPPELDTFYLPSTTTIKPSSYIRTYNKSYSISTHDDIDSIKTLNNLIHGQNDNNYNTITNINNLHHIPTNPIATTTVLSHSNSTISSQQQQQGQQQQGQISTTSTFLNRETSTVYEQVEHEVELSLHHSSHDNNSIYNNNKQQQHQYLLPTPTNQQQHHHHRYSSSASSTIAPSVFSYTSSSTVIPTTTTTSTTILTEKEKKQQYFFPKQILSKPSTFALNLSNPAVHRLYASYYDVRVASVDDVMYYVHTHIPQGYKEEFNNSSNNNNNNRPSSSSSSSSSSTTTHNNTTQTSSIPTTPPPVAMDGEQQQEQQQQQQKELNNSNMNINYTNYPPSQQPIDLSVNLALYSHLQQQKTRNVHIGTRIQSFVSSTPPSTRCIPIESIIGIEEFITIKEPFNYYTKQLYCYDKHNEENILNKNKNQTICQPLSKLNTFDRLYNNQGCNVCNGQINFGLLNTTSEKEKEKEKEEEEENIIKPPYYYTNYENKKQQCNHNNNNNNPSSSTSSTTPIIKQCFCAASHIYGIKIIYEVPQRLPQITQPEEYWIQLKQIDYDNRTLLKQQCIIYGWDNNKFNELNNSIPFPYLKTYRKQMILQFVDKNEQIVWLYSLMALKQQFSQDILTNNDNNQQSTSSSSSLHNQYSNKKLIVNNMPLYLKTYDFNHTLIDKRILKALRGELIIYNNNNNKEKEKQNEKEKEKETNNNHNNVITEQMVLDKIDIRMRSTIIEPLALLNDPQTALSYHKRFKQTLLLSTPSSTTSLKQQQQQNNSTGGDIVNNGRPTSTTSSSSLVQKQQHEQQQQEQKNVSSPTTTTTSSSSTNNNQQQLTIQQHNNISTAMVLKPLTKIYYRLPLISRIVSPGLLQLLLSQIGRKASLVQWHLGFSLFLDGADITLMWKTLQRCQHSLFLMKTNLGDVIGGYSGQQWKPEGGYHGNYESFVFRIYQDATYSDIENAGGTNKIDVKKLPQYIKNLCQSVDFEQLNQSFYDGYQELESIMKQQSQQNQQCENENENDNNNNTPTSSSLNAMVSPLGGGTTTTTNNNMDDIDQDDYIPTPSSAGVATFGNNNNEQNISPLNNNKHQTTTLGDLQTSISMLQPGLFSTGSILNSNMMMNSSSLLPSSMSMLQPGLIPSMSMLGTNMGTHGGGPIELTDQQQRYIEDCEDSPLSSFVNGIPEIYPWRGPLNYYVFTNRDAFGWGGGGGVAIYIWNSLQQGKSEFSGSYHNPQLTKEKEFKVYELEIWVGR